MEIKAKFEKLIAEHNIGDKVTLTVDEGYVTKMVDGEKKEENDEFADTYRIGTITSIDEEDKKIKIELSDGKTQTIVLASSYKMIDSDGATTLRLSKLSEGDNIIAIGEKSGVRFTASVIVLIHE